MLCFDSFFKKLTLYVSILLIYLDSLPNHGKCQINDIFPFLQWRVNAKLDGRSLLYYELGNSTWSWIWLDHWISGSSPPSVDSNHHQSKKSEENNTKHGGITLEGPRSSGKMKRRMLH